MAVKIKAAPILLAAAISVAAGALLPTAVDAAWWPWSKRQDRTEQPAPAAAGDATVAPGDVTERLDRAEAKIRELTGQIEELDFRVRQLQQELGLQNGNLQTNAAVAVVPDQAGGAATGAPPQDLGNLVVDPPPNQPIDLTASAGGAAAPKGNGKGKNKNKAGAQTASLGDAGTDYEHAYASILSGDYELAEASFRNFLTTYPNDQRAPDAQYWLGESLFARGQYSQAADEFLAGYKAYPKSGKAADTLLKLGLSLAGLGERDAACSTYAEVLKKYPDSSNALRQRVAAEQAVANC